MHTPDWWFETLLTGQKIYSLVITQYNGVGDTTTLAETSCDPLALVFLKNASSRKDAIV